MTTTMTGDDISAGQKARLHEVAELLLEVYRTLARMRYLRAEWIDEGPHDLEHLAPLFRELGLSPAVVYLYRILPYVSGPSSGDVDFFHGSEFADFRLRHNVERGRNPFYCDESDDEQNGQLMKPWMTPLSLMGNHQSVIIYSTRDHCIWILDQESGGSTDHGRDELTVPVSQEDSAQSESEPIESSYEFVEKEDAEDRGEASGVRHGEAVEQHDDGDEEQNDDEENDGDENDEDENDDEDEDEGDDDDDDDEDEDEDDYYDSSNAREADAVLRDMSRWYRELRETPGGGEQTSSGWESWRVRPLYRKHGWPGTDFDGEAFQADRVRVDARTNVDYRIDGELERIFERRRDLAGTDNTWAKRQARKQLAAACTVDDEWAAHWTAREGNQILQNCLEKFEYELNRLCSPNGLCHWFDELPLLEAKALQEASARAQEEVERASREVDEKENEKGEKHEEATAAARIRLSDAKEKAATYQRAFEESKADAERLWPGRPFQSATRVPAPESWEASYLLQTRNKSMEVDQREVEETQKWIEQLPDGAEQARNSAEQWIERHKRQVEQDMEEIRAKRAKTDASETDTRDAEHAYQNCPRCQKIFLEKEAEWRAATEWKTAITV